MLTSIPIKRRLWELENLSSLYVFSILRFEDVTLLGLRELRAVDSTISLCSHNSVPLAYTVESFKSFPLVTTTGIYRCRISRHGAHHAFAAR